MLIGTDFDNTVWPWTTVMHHFTLCSFFPEIAI